MSESKVVLPGDVPGYQRDTKNDLPAERRYPTAENLRNDVRSACRQLDNIREQCELRLTLKGQVVTHNEAFLDAFTHTVAVAMHTGWREDCQVLAVVIPRNSKRFQCRTTIASIELRSATVDKVFQQTRAPFQPVPHKGPLESLLVLIPAGKAEPQWATSISDRGRLHSILKALLTEYRSLSGNVLAVDPAEGLLM